MTDFNHAYKLHGNFEDFCQTTSVRQNIFWRSSTPSNAISIRVYMVPSLGPHKGCRSLALIQGRYLVM